MASLLGSSPLFKLQSIFFNRKAGVFDSRCDRVCGTASDWPRMLVKSRYLEIPSQIKANL